MLNRVIKLAKEVQSAASEADRSVASIVSEMLRLHFSKGLLGVTEYFDYELYKNDLSPAEKAAFGGWRAQAYLEKMLIDDLSEFMSIDKITMYSLFSGYGLPFPTVKAIFGSARPSSGTLQLNSADELIAFLRDESNLPVYIKPSSSSFGRGNFLVSGIEDGMYVLGNSEKIGDKELVDRLDNRRGLGWVLQEPLESHDDVFALTGTRKVSGLRIHSFMTPEGPTIVRAVWRINSGKTDFDQFRYGESGNLISEVDVESGKVVRVVGGFRKTRTVLSDNPTTGAKIVGFSIPHWEKIKSLVCDAHTAFPGYLCPGWDIAVCNDGPRILEVNAFGDIDTSQHAARKGFLDEHFLSLLKARNLLHEIPQGNLLRRMTWSQPPRKKFRNQWSW